jgi:hypothetical protein
MKTMLFGMFSYCIYMKDFEGVLCHQNKQIKEPNCFKRLFFYFILDERGRILLRVLYHTFVIRIDSNTEFCHL